MYCCTNRMSTFNQSSLLVLIFSCLAATVFSAPEECKQGPNKWCLNAETAKKCGAISFCLFEKQFYNKKIKFVPGQHKKQQHDDSGFKLDAPPVNVTLYYESLCPDCKEVWQYQLFPTFQKLASSGILNVYLVPYGNAQERQYGNQWIFYCQHGQAECIGNLIETCALHHYPNQNVYMPFLHCVEYYGPTATNARYCASLQKMDYSVISSCAAGTEGNQLQHQMALKTEALSPPHQYVPWFTMNGHHSYTIQQQLSSNMLAYVCDSYTGTKPAACSQRKKVGACYRNQ